MKKSFLLIALVIAATAFLLSAELGSATCTVTFGSSANYTDGETVTATMVCDDATEKSKAYTLGWMNGSVADIFENDTGTTPATINEPFYETYTLGSAYTTTHGDNITAALTGLNLEGFDTENVSAAVSTDLVIADISVTTDYYINKHGAVSFSVHDNSGDDVANALCIINIVDENNLPILGSHAHPSQGDGKLLHSVYLDEDVFEEGKQYKWDAACTCFNASEIDSGLAGYCFDESGSTMTFAHGESQYPFTIADVGDKMEVNQTFVAGATGIWVENAYGYRANMTASLATLWQDGIDWGEYNNSKDGEAFLTAGESFRMCMYVNNTFDDYKYVKVDQFHLIRKNGSLVHPLRVDSSMLLDEQIMNIGIKSFHDENLSYQKCSDWMIVPYHVKGQNNWKVAFHMLVEGFDQQVYLNSDRFTMFGQELGKDYLPIVDITSVNISAYGSSAVACSDVWVEFTYDYFGNAEDKFRAEYCFEQTDIDVVEGCFESNLNPDFGSDKTINETFQLPYFQLAGDAEVDVTIFKEDDNIIVGYGDTEPWNTFTVAVNSSDTCKYSQSYMQEIELRVAEALEDIANKTGTFRFSIDCPGTAYIGDVMLCNITAQIEADQTVQKEVDFTCYILDGSSRESLINFNQMVNRTASTVSRQFNVPADFINDKAYVVECEAGYYNLGSRTDTFYDSFIARLAGGGVGFRNVTTTTLPEDYVPVVLPPFYEDGRIFGMDTTTFALCVLVLIAVILTIVGVSKRRKKGEKEY